MSSLVDLIKIVPESERAAYDAEVAQRIAADDARKEQSRYERSGIPRRYWNESIETYESRTESQTAAADAVSQFIADTKAGKPRMLVILGPVGTGKTHLCGAVIRELNGQYLTSAELVEEIRHAKAFNADATEKQIVEKYARRGTAVLDEVGRASNAADEKYTLYLLQNEIYNLNGSVMYTSNFTKQEFMQYVGAAFMDRLVEYGQIVELKGESYRKVKRTENGL